MRRRILLVLAGAILVILIPLLLFWPEKAGSLTMILALVAMVLGYFAVKDEKK